MAPMKRPYESSAKNRDNRAKQRKYTSDTSDASMLYKCLGKLCGEECEQNLVTDNMCRGHDSPDEMEMDAGTDFSDDDMDNQNLRSSSHLKNTRQLKSKKKTELPLKIGMQKAKRYICEALEFGVQSGYLTLKDSKGQLLKVSSDLLQASNPNKSYVSDNQHITDPDTIVDRRLLRKRQQESQENRGDVQEARKQRTSRKQRSRSSKKRSRKSRSRSKRRHGRKRMGRSHSNNTELEANPKTAKGEDIEQDELDPNSKSNNSTNERNEDDNDDSQSIKSEKSNKSTLGSDSQNTTEKKKHNDDDISNYVSDDEDDKKK